MRAKMGDAKPKWSNYVAASADTVTFDSEVTMGDQTMLSTVEVKFNGDGKIS